MTLSFSIPGLPELRLEYLLLDVNGTLTNRGALLPDVAARLARLREELEIQLVSADTFGTLDSVSELLQVRHTRAASGADKLRLLDELGRERCAVIGNGANDVLVLEAAALGIVVLGPEGASAAALCFAALVSTTIVGALELLLEPQALSATLRS